MNMNSIPFPNVTRPIFGQSYATGYIGFTYEVENLLSKAIAFEERWENSRGKYPPVSHALVVVGDGECVEALMGQGVVKSPLSKYFDDDNYRIYLRKPDQWHAILGEIIAANALNKVGAKYDDMLIAEEVLYDSVLGHYVNKLFNTWPHRLAAQLLTERDKFICSMLAAYSLSACPEYAKLGCLKQPLAGISPQELFEDEQIFEPVINECSFRE